MANKLVIFHGNVKDVNEYLSSCAILCFPSLWEGFPNALIEALYCGLPIITTSRMRHLVDFIEHDINGLVVEDRYLMQSIQYLLGDSKKLKYYSENSFKKYELLAKKNPEKMWLKLIRSLEKK